ncbi:MAG: SH3 domain-containing protein [Chloroflexi bacterium]|nr:SH3 domain-containing protein [Chloroflexota bacterium]
MAKRPILIVILLIALFMMMTVLQGQDSDEACSSRDTVYPVVKTAILDEASYQGVRVRYATPWERLDIIGSKRFGPWCWLQVSDGWLIDNARALSSEPRDTATGSGSVLGRSCYRAERAYIIGNMNIRSGASTRSPVVANARAGDVFVVSDSMAGTEWCWLKINAGWLAKTSRVRSTKPTQPVVTGAVSLATSQPANIDNCCFVDRQCTTEQEWVDGYWAYQNNQCVVHGQTPSAGITIEGSETFVAQINAALTLLKTRAPQGYAYVTKGPRKIVEVQPPAADGSARHDHFFISSSAAKKPTHLVAWLMVHEACHVQRSLAGAFRYTTPQEVDLEEYLCDYVAHVSQQQVNYGRLIMAYTPSQVARLIRYGKLDQPTGTGFRLVSYLPDKVRQWHLAGIDFFGFLRAEIARADRLLG